MHKNRLFALFLALSGAVTLYFVVIALFALAGYSSKTQRAQPTYISWSYQQLGAENYAPVATFTFSVDGRQVEGTAPLSRPRFRNAAAAEGLFRELQERTWTVWYSPAHPEQATLERRFPFKESLSALALLSLFGYFIFLGFYVGRQCH